MACTLTIAGVTGITTNGTLTSIVATGEATNCTSVIVEIECGTAQPQRQSVAVDTSTSPGTWTVTFQAAPTSCVCTKPIKVTAKCDDQSEACIAELTSELECVEGGGGQVCPSISLIGLSASDCNPDGTRAIQITYQLNSASHYSAHLVDSNNNTIGAPLSNVVGPQTLSGGGNYAGTETFRVIVTQPAGCPGSTPFSDQIPVCLTCPSVMFTSSIGGSQGSYTVTVTATVSSPTAFTANLMEGTNTLASGSGGPASLVLVSPTESLPDNSSKTFEVVVTSPTTCGPAQLVVNAPSTQPPDGGGGGGYCDYLLWTAFGLIATGIVLTVIGVCTGNVALEAIGATALAVGLIILAVWYWLCGSVPGGCGTLYSIRCAVKFMVVYGWIIGLVLGWLHNWLCGGAALVGWGIWGLVYALLGDAQNNKHCPQPHECSTLPQSTSGP